MTALLPCGIIATLVIGWLVLRLLWPRETRRENAAILLVLSVGTGFGMVSCACFLWIAASGGRISSWPVIECVLLVATGIVAWFMLRKWKAGENRLEAVTQHRFGLHDGVLLVILALFVWLFVAMSLQHPNGDWDAWGIWNLHARFLFRGGQYWADGFAARAASHGDYPLLLPASVAGLWAWNGGESKLAPILVAALFAFGTILLLYLLVKRHGTPARALMAGILLMGTPLFVALSSWQYADIPLAFFILATIGLMVEYNRDTMRGKRLPALIGMAAAMAAWTKNEGIVFFVLVLAVGALLEWMRNGFRAAWWQGIAVLMGATPILATLILFKVAYAPGNDLFVHTSATASLSARLADMARWEYVLRRMGEGILKFGSWSITESMILSPIPVMAIWILVRRKGMESIRKAAARPALILFLMLAVYTVVYAASPHDLEWHMNTSLTRVLMHLWPSAIMLFSIAAAPLGVPEKPAAGTR